MAKSVKAGESQYVPVSFKLPNKGGVEATYKEIKPLNVGGITIVNTVNAKFGYEPTQDFKNAMRRLVPHLVRIMEIEHAYEIGLGDHLEQVTDLSPTSTYRFKDYYVTGVTVRDEGAAIQGGRKRSNGKVMNINSDFIRYGEAGAESTYQELAEFESGIGDAVAEFKAFLNGKYTAPAQQGLDFSPQVEKTAEADAA